MSHLEAMKQAELKHWLWYQPETGLFRWRYGSHNRMVKPWDVAGRSDNKGYVNITLRGRTYKAHRLAWLYMTGSFPSFLIDHKNRNKSDNSFDNLREVNKTQNNWNTSIRIDNKSGVKGVHFCKTWKRWIASVRVNGIRHHVGRFLSIEEAKNAVIKFRKEHHGEYAN